MKRKDPGIPKVLRYRLKLLEEIVSFHFSPRAPVPYSGVCLNARIHPTSFERLSSRKLIELQKLVPIITDRKLSARLNDVLWTKRKELLIPPKKAIAYAQMAVRQFLEVPLSEDAWDFGIDTQNAIRGICLAQSLGTTGAPLLEAFKQRLRILFSNERLSYEAALIVKEWKDENLCREAALVLMEQAKRLLTHENHLPAITNLEQAETLARALPHEPDLLIAINRDLIHTHIAYAAYLEQAGRKAVQIKHQLELAYEELRALPKTLRRCHDVAEMEKTIQIQLDKLKDRVKREMRTVTVVQQLSIHLDPEFERILQSELPAFDKWKSFAALPLALTNAEYLQMNEFANGEADHSFASCFRRIRKSPDGRTIARTDNLGKFTLKAERDQAVRFAMADQHANRMHALGPVIFEHLRALKTVASLNPEQFVELTRNSIWIPPYHSRQIALAIYHGQEENWIEASHLLGPQMEAMVRHRLKQIHISTISRKDGIEHELGLSSLAAHFSTIVEQSIAFDIKTLFCDQMGRNLRNDIAHGLREDPTDTPCDVLYAWWLTLHLLLCHGTGDEQLETR